MITQRTKSTSNWFDGIFELKQAKCKTKYKVFLSVYDERTLKMSTKFTQTKYQSNIRHNSKIHRTLQ